MLTVLVEAFFKQVCLGVIYFLGMGMIGGGSIVKQLPNTTG